MRYQLLVALLKRFEKRVRQLIRQTISIRLFKNYIYIVGAQKAGTTSLHSFLVQHPCIVGGSLKEIGFFHREKMYTKGLSFYKSHFPLFSGAKYALDSTPEYLYIDTVPERIHTFQPNAKIIILLREPISRAYSAFNMYKQLVGKEGFSSLLLNSNSSAKEFYLPIAKGLVDPDIEYFIDRELEIMHNNKPIEEPSLIRRGIYAAQINPYMELFGCENILVLFSDDLREQTKKTVNQVFDFLGLPTISGIDLEPKHEREYIVDSLDKKQIQKYASDLFAQDKNNLKEKYEIITPW